MAKAARACGRYHANVDGFPCINCGWEKEGHAEFRMKREMAAVVPEAPAAEPEKPKKSRKRKKK